MDVPAARGISGDGDVAVEVTSSSRAAVDSSRLLDFLWSLNEWRLSPAIISPALADNGQPSSIAALGNKVSKIVDPLPRQTAKAGGLFLCSLAAR